MGQNLILNMNDKGFTVAAYNRTTSKVDDFLANEAKGTKVVGAHSVEEFVSLLKRPRKIILLVKAGAAVDAFIEQLLPHLEKGDIIIDGGNSHFPDTERRCKEIEAKGLLYVGSGVSGGEEGARHGPSLMPGGSEDAWTSLKDIFQKTAAQSDGEPCCDWVGGGGAGRHPAAALQHRADAASAPDQDRGKRRACRRCPVGAVAHLEEGRDRGTPVQRPR